MPIATSAGKSCELRLNSSMANILLSDPMAQRNSENNSSHCSLCKSKKPTVKDHVSVRFGKWYRKLTYLKLIIQVSHKLPQLVKQRLAPWHITQPLAWYILQQTNCVLFARDGLRGVQVSIHVTNWLRTGDVTGACNNEAILINGFSWCNSY